MVSSYDFHDIKVRQLYTNDEHDSFLLHCQKLFLNDLYYFSYSSTYIRSKDLMVKQQLSSLSDTEYLEFLQKYSLESLIPIQDSCLGLYLLVRSFLFLWYWQEDSFIINYLTKTKHVPTLPYIFNFKYTHIYINSIYFGIVYIYSYTLSWNEQLFPRQMSLLCIYCSSIYF